MGGAPCVDPGNGTALPDGECRCNSVAMENYCCDNGAVSTTASSCIDGGSSSGGSGSGSGSGPSSAEDDTFGFGTCGVDDGASYEKFRALTTSATQPRRCHIYTYWNIANVPFPPGVPDATGAQNQADLKTWLTGAGKADCDEVLVTFKGAGRKNAAGDPVREDPPPSEAYKTSFGDFLTMALSLDAGYWRGRLSFTAWNEPNNPALGGNGLDEQLSPEKAAEYYLIAQNICNEKSKGCAQYDNAGLVAAGDFATNGSMGEFTDPNGGSAGSIAVNCHNDEALEDGGLKCGSRSSYNPNGWGPSYLDRYKFYIASHVAGYSNLKSGWRPHYWAYHPWHDVNSYIDSNASCPDYEHCTTRRLLASLTDSWGSADIWDTEISVGQQNGTLEADARPRIHSDQEGQIALRSDKEGWISEPKAMFDSQTKPCGEAFLAQLTKLSPRVRRLYYMFYGYSNGALLTAGNPQPPPLATLERTIDGAGCAATGFESTYSNPIIPMFSLDAPSERGPVSGVSPNPTEGCPDPQGMRAHDGHYYIYCTSYSNEWSRYGGFPIFEADTLANNEWKRVGWLISPKGGEARDEWPDWIEHANGDFWGPDVHEVTNHKGDRVYVALYAAPHRYRVKDGSKEEEVTTQSIGMAWAPSPTGPWTHYQGHPFIAACGEDDLDCKRSACAGSASKDCDGDASGVHTNGTKDSSLTYDPNLLIANGKMYLYWAVKENGILGQEVKLKSDDGELELVGSPKRVAEKGEGPYAFERSGRTYLFYSTSNDGILDDYEVLALSSPDPLRAVRTEKTDAGKEVVENTWEAAPDPVLVKTSGTGWSNGPKEVNSLAFVGTGGNSIIPDVNGTDMLVYHGIVVPQGDVHDIWCADIEDDHKPKTKQDSSNPYCRGQGERQAMMDPIKWVTDPSTKIDWPVVNEGQAVVPGVTRSAAQASTGPVPVP